MRIFRDTNTMEELFGAHKKWQRVLEGMETIPKIRKGAMYSVGDSLTYRYDDAENLASDEFIGRRRYQLCLVAVNGELQIEIARKNELTELTQYSDLSDRETFTGKGQAVIVKQNAVLVADIDEAVRIIADKNVTAVEFHLTVEGTTFHNK